MVPTASLNRNFCHIILKIFISIFIILSWHQFAFTQTINSENLNRLIAFCDSSKADEILISHKDKIITHWKRTDHTKPEKNENPSKCNTHYMGTASMVKSWTGLLIGVLIDKKYIKSVDDLVCDYIPDWQVGCKNKITIKHLLTMSAGFKRLGATGILSQSNVNQFALNLKPDTLPGIKFSYSNESVQLLGILAEQVTKQKGDKLFKQLLLQPLGIDSTEFSKDSAGNVIFFGGCTTTVLNAHKIGKLMLNNGKYNDKQIVSENWIQESTTSSPLASYYGYLWWIDKKSKYWNYAATGDLGQMTIVFPELELIFVRKQSCDLSQASLNMSWMGPDFLKSIFSIIEE